MVAEKITTLRLPDELRAKLEAKAFETRWTMNDLLTQALVQRLNTPDAEAEALMARLGRDREGRLPPS